MLTAKTGTVPSGPQEKDQATMEEYLKTEGQRRMSQTRGEISSRAGTGHGSAVMPSFIFRGGGRVGRLASSPSFSSANAPSSPTPGGINRAVSGHHQVVKDPRYTHSKVNQTGNNRFKPYTFTGRKASTVTPAVNPSEEFGWGTRETSQAAPATSTGVDGIASRSTSGKKFDFGRKK